MKVTKIFQVRIKTESENNNTNDFYGFWAPIINDPYIYVTADNIGDAVNYVSCNLKEIIRTVPNLIPTGRKPVGIRSAEEYKSDIIVPEEMVINVKVC